MSGEVTDVVEPREERPQRGALANIGELLRSERRARLFLLISAQSAIGNGAAVPALMVLAYDRRHSAWAITAVLLAYLLPPGVLGPFAGAAVDRFSRRRCAVAADWLRALAFGGIALVPGFGVTVALAFVAGAGTALFSPAVLAALPSLVDDARAPAITSAYGGLGDAGRMAGPALAAVGFAVVGATGVLAINAATFVISALALMRLPFGAALPGEHAPGGHAFFRDVADGLRGPMRMRLIRTVVIASTLVILFAAMISPAELPLARAYGGGASALGLLLAVFGVGVVSGSLSGARSGALRDYERRYLLGALAGGAGLAAIATAPGVALGLAGFFLFGVGNGLVVVHERLIFQEVVPVELVGRAFAVLDAFGAWAFASAYVIGGALTAGLGARTCAAIAAGGAVAVWGLATLALRPWRRRAA